MAIAPDTWTLLNAVKTFVQNNLTVTDSLVTNASPFTAFSTADAATYGVTNAIYPWQPKSFTDQYPRQCVIVPAEDNVYRRAFGGKVWDELHVHIVFAYLNNKNSYQIFQDLIKARDAMYPIITKHAELVNAPIVAASKPIPGGTGRAPTGFFHNELIGWDWDLYGFVMWYRQEYTVGTIVP